ncbi:hypothetical protein ACFFLM_08290 [Deinococcus oregonensis]|uniref:Uncharacterized protein n=1 Tax=Deinococcus oregonensis TaxID=1805970 RepID=A0ABV6AY69_9DEIO
MTGSNPLKTALPYFPSLELALLASWYGWIMTETLQVLDEERRAHFCKQDTR